METGIFKKYYERLAKEGWLKAFVCGLIVGFSVLAVVSAALWISANKGFWIALVAWGVSVVIATPIFYTFKFRPTTKDVARRVDELGLDERLITMVELEGDSSYIAMKQREDAKAALGKVDAGLIKLGIAVPLIIAVSAVGVLGIGMNVVSGLYDYGKIEDGGNVIDDIIDKIEPDPPTFEVYYETEGEGYIEGDIFQIVTEGKDASPVVAVADEGWVFVGWSDEYADPYRADSDIKSDMIKYAVFQETGDGEDGDPGDGDGGGPQENELPSDPTSSGEGTPSSNEGGNSDPGSGSNGKYKQNDKIIDNETYYGDIVYDAAYQEALERILNNDNLTEEEKKLILEYFNTIEK